VSHLGRGSGLPTTFGSQACGEHPLHGFLGDFNGLEYGGDGFASLGSGRSQRLGQRWHAGQQGCHGGLLRRAQRLRLVPIAGRALPVVLLAA
jgi:hypothetical protein